MFTDNSQLLINYIDGKLYPKHSKRSKKKSHKISKKISLYKEYRDLYKFLSSINTHFVVNEIKHISVVNEIKQTSVKTYAKIDSPFISKNISDEIKTLNNYKSYILKTNKSVITINIYYSDEDLTEFIMIINKALSFIFNISLHSVTTCTINYYLSGAKKIMDQYTDYSNEEFSNKEVNSGSCNGSTKTITIWRKEEILKVTLHECMHLLEYDEVNEDYLLKEFYKKKYKVSSSSMNIFEAYTETWAELMNCFLVNTLMKGNQHSFVKYLEYEKFFSHYQSAKIFYIKSLKEKPLDLNKYTNVLPYYIIKCEIFNDLRGFLNHCKNKNNNIDYVKIKDNFKDFLEELDVCKKDNKLFTKIDKKSYRYITMRMSCLEYKLFA